MFFSRLVVLCDFVAAPQNVYNTSCLSFGDVKIGKWVQVLSLESIHPMFPVNNTSNSFSRYGSSFLVPFHEELKNGDIQILLILFHYLVGVLL